MTRRASKLPGLALALLLAVLITSAALGQEGKVAGRIADRRQLVEAMKSYVEFPWDYSYTLWKDWPIDLRREWIRSASVLGRCWVYGQTSFQMDVPKFAARRLYNENWDGCREFWKANYRARKRFLIGFRNPTIHMAERDYALIIPMLNPEAVVRETAKFGRPILLNLTGLGIRDMARWDDEFLIIGGDYRDRFDPDAKPSHLFRWKGGEQDQPVDLNVDFGDLNPEAIAALGEGVDARVLLLSDDGEMKVSGNPNKEYSEAEQFFRGVWLQVLRQ